MRFKRHPKQSTPKLPSNDTPTAGNSNPPGLRIRSADSRAHTHHSSSMPNVATHPSNPLLSVMRRAARPIRRFLGRNASSVQESGVGPGVTQLSPDSKSTPSLLPSDQNIRKVPSASNTSTVGSDKAICHPQPAAKKDYLAPLAVPTLDSSSAALAGDGTETVLGVIKLSLQTATSVLKLVPIAHLDEIPTLLLSWIQIYETVRGNSDDLDGLCEGIHKAWHSVVEPIQNWRGDRPPELETLVFDFRRALEKQFGNVILLLGQNVIKKTVRVTDIAQQITTMRTCLNDAIYRFQLRISTLDFLHTQITCYLKLKVI
ncbi:uncharacterized protein EI90DRAFT_3290514 [Cantharellus anzutake]|uniref:uncharacterized protein n=1 Tax=Cantharellus anzutake TaxID=1750568 RepID=UPI0019086685|nr:uncharacterized protein EI90DRAFT_3290514 [Cantharellus anzutake]KAF8328595.1 hypothetical protein EI90DRAFT_3290514 [Cantharellus anzutake]